jgi:hypothetical protein
MRRRDYEWGLGTHIQFPNGKHTRQVVYGLTICRPTKPAPPACLNSFANTGAVSAVCITVEMSLYARMLPVFRWVRSAGQFMTILNLFMPWDHQIFLW